MPSFSVTEPVAAPASRTGQTVGNFGDDSWISLPMTVEGTGIGAARSIEWAGTYDTDDPAAMEAGLARAYAHRLAAMRDHIEGLGF